MHRRAFLGASISVVFGGCIGSGDSGQATTYDEGWFENVDNYDGEVDRTDTSTVTVAVGGSDDGLAFEPAAIRVTPGTTVVWEWTGRGGRHNVVAADETFKSEFHDEGGTTFEYDFDTPGVYQYYCEPHEELGMKGGVRVVEE
jgi:halocyanin-like protein